jgi:hypothetical protein
MTCARVYDFINGTTVTLPRHRVVRSDEDGVWDILHPNQRASSLVARHIRTLATKGWAKTEDSCLDVSAKDI